MSDVTKIESSTEISCFPLHCRVRVVLLGGIAWWKCMVELLGGEVDFSVLSGFVVDLEVELTLVLVNVKGLGGGGGEQGR